MKRLIPGLVIGALVLGSSAVAAADGDTLSAVQERGVVVCGVNGGLPGMSVLNSETGLFEGMDGDYCRAVAAAVFGDDSKVQFATLTADQRATAVQGGEVDVLFRNTTQTTTRDASWGDFGPVIFYDGQDITRITEHHRCEGLGQVDHRLTNQNIDFLEIKRDIRESIVLITHGSATASSRAGRRLPG